MGRMSSTKGGTPAVLKWQEYTNRQLPSYISKSLSLPHLSYDFLTPSATKVAGHREYWPCCAYKPSYSLGVACHACIPVKTRTSHGICALIHKSAQVPTLHYMVG